MTDFNMKKSALQLLVINGILTQEEVEKCIEAISDDSLNSYNMKKIGSNSSSNIVFEDENICVIYKSMAKVNNLFFGEGISFKFIVQNKTGHEIRVEATDITINDFVVSNSELICSEAAPYKKTIDNFSLYSGALDDIDVTEETDIYSLELAISYEIADLDYEYESSLYQIDL